MKTQAPRLDPFLFSPNTNFRFLLLIVSVLGASLFAYYNLHTQLYDNELVREWLRCSEEAESAFPIAGLDISSPEYINQSFSNVQFNAQCYEPMEKSQAYWILRWLGLLLLTAGLIYWFLPQARIWRDKLTKFTAEDDPELMEFLLNLSQLAGLSKPPIFLLRPLNSSPSGLAFGRLGSYYVVLNGGLVALFYQERGRFKAIVLHELAHLRNKDVDKTYFSLALGVAFLFVTFLPHSVGNLFSLIGNFWGNLEFFLWQTVIMLLFIPIIYAALASILRSREVYADARLPVLDNQDTTLRNELASLSASRNHFWESLFGLHPNPAWRLKVFDEPDMLFGLSYADAFLAGIISTFPLRELDIFLVRLLPPGYESYSLIGANLFLVPVVISVVGLGIWQRVFVSQVRGQKLSGFGRYGLSLGVGMLIGMALSFSAFVDNSIAYSDSSAPLVFLFNLVLSGIFLVSLFLVCRWIAAGASVWLETVSHPVSLRRVTSFGLLTTGLMMSYWVGVFYTLNKFGKELVFTLQNSFGTSLEQGSDTLTSSLVLISIILTTPGVISILLWSFPLLSKIRKTRTHLENIFIEVGETAQVPAKVHPYLRPLPALLVGLAVTLVSMIFLIIVRVLLHLGVDEATRTSQAWLMNLNAIQLGLVIVVQVLVAIVVSALVKKFGWAHGLFAAFVTGFLLAIGLNLVIEISDCIPILQLGMPLSCTNFMDGDPFLWVGAIITLGTIFCYPMAFFMSWMGTWIRERGYSPKPA